MERKNSTPKKAEAANSPPKERKPTQKVVQKDWIPLFLKILGNTANVRAACEGARGVGGIGIDRSTAYKEREADPEFAEAWKMALKDACDELAAKARVRAMNGSDTLMIFLLKAHDPETYGEKVKLTHDGKIKNENVSLSKEEYEEVLKNDRNEAVRLYREQIRGD